MGLLTIITSSNQVGCSANQRPEPPEKLIASARMSQKEIDEYNQKNYADYYNKLAEYNNSNSKAVPRSSRPKRAA